MCPLGNTFRMIGTVKTLGIVALTLLIAATAISVIVAYDIGFQEFYREARNYMAEAIEWAM